MAPKTKKANPLIEDENLDNGAEELGTQEVSKTKVEKKVNIEAEAKGEEKIVKAALDKESKVRILIPLVGSEKKGVSQESVTINGYRMTIPKGIYVDVPQSVADIIERHYNTTPENTEVGEKFDLSRNRVKDGSSTDDALL